MKLPRPCLALVTDRRSATAPLEEVVARAVTGGVDLVQLREKDLPAAELFGLAERLRRVTAGRALFVINDRIDVALAVGADGVHLPENGLAVEIVRRLAGDRLLIGRSVHSIAGALAVRADYLQVGTIYATGSKPGVAPAGPALVQAIAREVDAPVLAVGGIGVGNVDEVIRAGATGVAVISAVMGAADPTAAAAEMTRALVAAWTRHGVAP